MTGVGINLSPFDTRLTCSFVGSLLERFLIRFLFASRVSFERSMRLIFLRSFRFLLTIFHVLLDRLRFPFTANGKSQIPVTRQP